MYIQANLHNIMTEHRIERIIVAVAGKAGADSLAGKSTKKCPVNRSAEMLRSVSINLTLKQERLTNNWTEKC